MSINLITQIICLNVRISKEKKEEGEQKLSKSLYTNFNAYKGLMGLKEPYRDHFDYIIYLYLITSKVRGLASITYYSIVPLGKKLFIE